MIGACGALAVTLAAIARDRRDAPALEFGRRQHARPGIEDLHRFRAGRQLTDEIFGRGVDEPVDQGGEQIRMAVGEEARRRLIGRAAPGDHIARDRPRRAAEADQRDVVAAARSSGGRAPRTPARAGSSRARGGASPGRRRRRSGRGAGRRPISKATRWPSASGMTRMSENRIAASKPNRRIGCSVASTASAGV